MKQQGLVDGLLMNQLDQLKNKRNQANLHIEQLKLKLIQKSQEKGSLPEYELTAAAIKSVIPSQTLSPTAELMIKDYVVERELMAGAQAKVFLRRSVNKDNTHVVVKVYQVYSVTDTEAGIKEVLLFSSKEI
jgi:hypothetical protein